MLEIDERDEEDRLYRLRLNELQADVSNSGPGYIVDDYVH